MKITMNYYTSHRIRNYENHDQNHTSPGLRDHEIIINIIQVLD